jgi:hypothetical protein
MAFVAALLRRQKMSAVETFSGDEFTMENKPKLCAVADRFGISSTISQRNADRSNQLIYVPPYTDIPLELNAQSSQDPDSALQRLIARLRTPDYDR